jgi:hypothetical protein
MDKTYKIKKTYCYQLISPILGDKIHESSSLNKAADKCYQEFKDTGIKSDQFVVLNIDTNEPFIFKLRKRSNIPKLIGGNTSPSNNLESKIGMIASEPKPDQNNDIPKPNTSTNIDVVELEKRVSELENIVKQLKPTSKQVENTHNEPTKQLDNTQIGTIKQTEQPPELKTDIRTEIVENNRKKLDIIEKQEKDLNNKCVIM